MTSQDIPPTNQYHQQFEAERAMQAFAIRSGLRDRVHAHCAPAGYSAKEIDDGLAYAYRTGFSSDDEALSLTISRILYSDSQLADGARYEVTL
jgi:hypothetical protein